MPPLLRELLRPHRVTLSVLFGLILVQTAMSLAVPWPLKIILDNVVGDLPPPAWIAWLLPTMGGTGKIHMAEAAGVVTVAIAVVTGIAFYISSYLTEKVGQSVGNDLRVRLYHHLQELSLSYYDKNRVGTLLSTLTGDVQSIQNFASTNTLNIATDSITLVGMVIVMFMLRWDFTLIALTVTPLLALFVLRINRAVKLAVRDVRMAQSDLLSTLQEGLQSIELVQAYSRQDLAERQLRKASGDSVAAWLATRRLSAVLSPAVGLVIALCTAVVLWRGSLLILGGVMTAGALTVFLTYLAKFFQPVRDLSVMSNTIAQVSVGFERVTAICDSDKTVPERPMPKDPAPFRGEIEFGHVAFGYDPDRPVLRDVTFSIAPGQKVGIVGPTGSGKSTLVSLIPRFRDLNGGSIRIDGGDILDYRLYGLRSQIGFVLQETILLRGTVRDNIAFGRPDASEDEIIEAATQANAHEFIVKMPEGYDSFIGDRGATLSGGQRQRIGIARALIRDNPILILDEPTAALDAESEELVIEALDRLMEGRTVITIAHRLSTLRTADKIIVIKDGTVAEDGSHDELMALDGVYAGLHRLQFGTHT